MPANEAHTSHLRLGRIECSSTTTLPPRELREGGRLELTAIRLDGSEVPMRFLKSISTSMMFSYDGNEWRNPDSWPTKSDPLDAASGLLVLVLLWFPRWVSTRLVWQM